MTVTHCAIGTPPAVSRRRSGSKSLGWTRMRLFLPPLLLLALSCAGPETDQATPQPAELERALSAVLSELELQPFGSPAQPTEVRVKSGPAYQVATGVATQTEQAGRRQIVSVLRSQGWTVRRQGSVAHFLGWEAQASKGSMVLLASVGEAAVVGDNSPYVREPGRIYLQLSVAGADTGPSWSVVNQ